MKNLYEFIFSEKMIGDYEQSRSTGLNPRSKFAYAAGYVSTPGPGHQKPDVDEEVEQQNQQ
jgi:hypothetical protein